MRHQVARGATHHDQAKQRSRHHYSSAAYDHEEIEQHPYRARCGTNRMNTDRGDGGTNRKHEHRRSRDANQREKVAPVQAHRAIDQIARAQRGKRKIGWSRVHARR